MKEIYLDYAAATPVRKEVLSVMEPYLNEKYGNPSSFHMAGKSVRDEIEQARSVIAEILGCKSQEIIFTSGGTESDNLAILGVARANKQFGKHIITTAIEHEAVLSPVKQLQKEGFEVTIVGVDEYGSVNPSDIESALREDTILVSVMYANNEIGTIQPIAEIGKILKASKNKTNNPQPQTSSIKPPFFHIDACQAAGALSLDVRKLHVDLMTLNSGKIYGPKGTGLLYIANGTKISPLCFGGYQERMLRPGTENAPGIIGFAKALELAQKERVAESERLTKLRDMFVNGVLETIPKTRLNGHPTSRLPNSANISFLDVEGEALLLYLDAQGVYASTGSACTSASLDPSHVILALGLPREVAHGSMRFSLGKGTTEKDIMHVLQILPPIVEKLRSISPVRVNAKYAQSKR